MLQNPKPSLYSSTAHEALEQVLRGWELLSRPRTTRRRPVRLLRSPVAALITTSS